MTARRLPLRVVLSLIELYRHTISPLRPPSCRFTPTCSQYAVDALTEFGVIRGGGLAVLRLLKCGPWHSGGWDPIPDRMPDPAECQGEAAVDGRGVVDDLTNTVQQGESRTHV